MTGPDAKGEAVADVIASLLKTHAGLDLPVRLRAWDGSEAGPEGLPVAVLRSPEALRRMLWRPGELGLARAYISGDLDVEGDLTEGLRRVLGAVRATPAPAAPARISGTRASQAAHLARTAMTWTPAALAAVKAAGRLKVLGPPWFPPPAPSSELKVSGRLHSRARDQAVIAGHYDVPAAFYQLILDPNMAYSCAWYPGDQPKATLEDAQRAKLEMICRKLALEPGAKLLDMGCGWGSLTVRAARDHRARVTAVTLSGEQGGYVRERVRGLGLGERAEVRIQDYRDAGGGPYDAIASVEMGEHVGAANYPRFCAELHRLLRPGGRLLIQQMSRGPRAPGGGPFIESYIAADMTMRPVGDTIRLIENAGFEVIGVEAMRTHYVRTIRAWLENFERQLPAISEILTAEQIRVWRLYLAGGALAFEEGRMGVDQILAVRPER
ncbi:MAG: cyclopropane-fatty-acyl-phospholipid synthase family protein [Actinomycetota bacterium]|nr:cyclopropane-fatty-acyl-phospholipid synthase family protein [Actinomycetota bacterium]